MKVRGERECKECGAQWSYFETGSVECPSCGSLLSVGVGDRAQHTNGSGTLDLSGTRQAAGDEPVGRAASVAEDECRDYLRSRGFISGGELLDLDEVYVAAQELKHAAATIASRLSVDEAIERYFYALIRSAEDGSRLRAEDVPRSLRSARGLGAAAAVGVYLDDLRAYVDDPDTGTPDDALRFVERLRDHEKRVRALDGNVDPETADALVDAANEVGDYLRTGSAAARDAASATLDELAA